MATREDSRETLSLHNIKGLRIKFFNAQNKVKSSHQIIVGELTTLLIEQGHLSRGEWQRERPLYSRDVDTTFECPESSFYINTNQYRRLRLLYHSVQRKLSYS